MDELRVALRRAGETIADYREALPEARVTPVAGRHDVRRSLGELPDGPTPLDEVVEHLVDAASGRVALVRGGHVAVEQHAHARQLGGETVGELGCAGVDFLGGQPLPPRLVAQLQADLAAQLLECARQ